MEIWPWSYDDPCQVSFPLVHNRKMEYKIKKICSSFWNLPIQCPKSCINPFMLYLPINIYIIFLPNYHLTSGLTLYYLGTKLGLMRTQFSFPPITFSLISLQFVTLITRPRYNFCPELVISITVFILCYYYLKLKLPQQLVNSVVYFY